MMKKIAFISLITLLAIIIDSCNTATQEQTSNDSITDGSSIKPSYKIIAASEVEWTHLNPKRGDLAPKAGTLWGDRNGSGPTGFLLKPTDGFESPPHIHNVSYRGIVIKGLIHNGDPNAEQMWMPAGSFWTQPKGEIHITAAKGSNTLAYIEIEEGPYLVLSKDEHFDSGERPVNVDQSNVVWVDTNDLTWGEKTANNTGAKVAFLWGKPVADKLNGTFLSIPPGFVGKIITNDSEFKAVLIKGDIEYHEPEKANPISLSLGSFFGSEKKSYHTISNAGQNESIIYIRSIGTYEIL